MKIIEIVVSPQGEVRLETHGFTGASCREGSQFLEQALGSPMAEQLTSAYHQQSISESTRLTQDL